MSIIRYGSRSRVYIYTYWIGLIPKWESFWWTLIEQLHNNFQWEIQFDSFHEMNVFETIWVSTSRKCKTSVFKQWTVGSVLASHSLISTLWNLKQIKGTNNLVDQWERVVSRMGLVSNLGPVTHRLPLTTNLCLVFRCSLHFTVLFILQWLHSGNVRSLPSCHSLTQSNLKCVQSSYSIITN